MNTIHESKLPENCEYCERIFCHCEQILNSNPWQADWVHFDLKYDLHRRDILGFKKYLRVHFKEQMRHRTYDFATPNVISEGSIAWSMSKYFFQINSHCKHCNVPTVFFDQVNPFEDFLPLRKDSLIFISCYGLQTSLTYRIYTSPFELSLWLLIVLFAILTGISLFWFSNLRLEQMFPVFTLPFTTLLEMVDLTEQDIPKTRKLKTVMTTWFLASVVLSNAYKGILTSDLTAFKPTKGLDSFNDLGQADLIVEVKDRCFSIIANQMPEDQVDIVTYLEDQQETKLSNSTEIKKLLAYRNDSARDGTVRAGMTSPNWIFSVCSTVASAFFTYTRQELYERFRVENKIRRGVESQNQSDGLPNISLEHMKKVIDVSSRLIYPETPNTMENIALSCDRIAYLDFESRILNFQVPPSKRLQLLKKPLVMGTDKLFTKDVSWVIHHDGGLTTFLRVVFQAGIFGWVESRINALQQTGSELKFWQNIPRGAQQLEVNSNFTLTLFHMYSFLLGICFISILVEILSLHIGDCYKHPSY
ncbi:unnamed protein product [Allacma fusca]|uniref:Uncharacterized protein n=1 Tax=Allacma fusca TaxID=39272 RepID=A0A8J2PCD7_9HEXA|nr:unnamed protein product [Allacma fusca]